MDGCCLVCVCLQRTWRLGVGGVEAGEVDEGVGGQEEVGDDGSDNVQVAYKHREHT